MTKTRKSLQVLVVEVALLFTASFISAQKDPGVRGGIQNTGGGLQQQGIPIPHPPLMSAHPTTHVTVNENELKSFEEGAAGGPIGVNL